MATALVVREPFGEYGKGDTITDPAAVSEILASDNANHVIKTVREVQE